MQPESYTEIVASILLLIAVLFSISSFWSKIRPVSLRLFAILLVAVMAIFSNHMTTYFAAIFIIATAVTELEFLQNLAAIISKNKHYFDYKREFMTKDEVEKKTADSVQTEETATEDDQASIHDKDIPPEGMRKTPLSRLNLFRNTESKALRWIKVKKDLNIQQFVRFRNDNNSVELDGFVDGGKNSEDQIIEVKVIQNASRWMPRNEVHAYQAVETYYKYTEITKRKAKLILILVFMNEEVKKNYKAPLSRLSRSRISYEYHCLTIAELDKELNAQQGD